MRLKVAFYGGFNSIEIGPKIGLTFDLILGTSSHKGKFGVRTLNIFVSPVDGGEEKIVDIIKHYGGLGENKTVSLESLCVYLHIVR